MDEKVLINKAFLKDHDIKQIEEDEINKFKLLYGTNFENLLDVNMTELWFSHSKILFHFNNILKF